MGKKIGRKPVKCKRRIRGVTRDCMVWKDSSGKVHVNVIRQPTFEQQYNSAVQANKPQLMRRRLTPEVKKALSSLVEEDHEWGGGVDFEAGTKRPERILATHGWHAADTSGPVPFMIAHAPADERVDFELLFHTHPSRMKWVKPPSPADLSIISLDAPELVPTEEKRWYRTHRSKNGRKLKKPRLVSRSKKIFFLARSIHKNRVPRPAIDAIYQKTISSAPLITDKVIQAYKHELNKIGLDFKQINPEKHWIWMRKDKIHEKSRDIHVTRRKQRIKKKTP